MQDLNSMLGVKELPRIVRVRYEGGVLKILDEVELEEGKEYKIVIEENIDELIHKYKGSLGKSSIEEFKELEEESQIQ